MRIPIYLRFVFDNGNVLVLRYTSLYGCGVVDAVMRFYAHIVCLLNGTHNKNPLYTMKP